MSTSTTSLQTTHDTEKKHRELLEDSLLRRFFYVPSFEIYGGVGGLYDLGPPGCGIRDNLVQYWRKHFVVYDNILELSCSALTSEIVLKTSGHVDRFTDFMVRDSKDSDKVFRADKLIEEWCEQQLLNKTSNVATQELQRIKSLAGAMNQHELHDVIIKHNIKSPDTGNDLTEPFAFNLMFSTSIGPTGKQIGYLRPETAQGMFVNYRRLLDYNQGRIPFGAAQIGLAFRNEIAPRSGLLRVREFLLAEIEYFVEPIDKSHSRFNEVKDITLSLLPREQQTGDDICIDMSIGDAVSQGTINNETLGYYLGRTQLFMLAIGIDRKRLRFRQHKSNEMAHYAADCWDAEIYMNTYGWIEVVGHADRSAYDLRVHSEKSKVELYATKIYEPPIVKDLPVIKPNFAKLGKTYGKQSQHIIQQLKSLTNDQARTMQQELQQSQRTSLCIDANNMIELTSGQLDITFETKKISTEKYIPNVIEPAFGIGRILYGILDHTFYIRSGGDDKRSVLGIPALLAPIKVAVLPLSNNTEFETYTTRIQRMLAEHNIYSKLDAGAVSIGRRYARADEIGTPYAVTVDFDTVKIDNNPVTIRERDTTQQIRLSLNDVLDVIIQLLHNKLQWNDVYNKYEQVIRDE